MAHDVLWLSTRSDHPDEIAVHVEDGRHPDEHEARDVGSRNWASSRRTSSPVVSSLGLARLKGPAHLLLPSQRQKPAVLLQVLK
jgi:hypothetical protein